MNTSRETKNGAFQAGAGASPSLPGVSRWRWIICALLLWPQRINYIDRQILSLLKPILDEQLGWTNEQFGYVNALFQGAYALSYLGFGDFHSTASVPGSAQHGLHSGLESGSSRSCRW
jgi:sugar phosphate permease